MAPTLLPKELAAKKLALLVIVLTLSAKQTFAVEVIAPRMTRLSWALKPYDVI